MSNKVREKLIFFHTILVVCQKTGNEEGLCHRGVSVFRERHSFYIYKKQVIAFFNFSGFMVINVRHKLMKPKQHQKINFHFQNSGEASIKPTMKTMETLLQMASLVHNTQALLLLCLSKSQKMMVLQMVILWAKQNFIYLGKHNCSGLVKKFCLVYVGNLQKI